MNKVILKLYVTGKSPKSESAITNLRNLCDKQLDGEYEIRIVDVLERPQLAENERIIATPTLIRELPPPIRKIIGDLTDIEKVLLGLDLQRPIISSKKEKSKHG